MLREIYFIYNEFAIPKIYFWPIKEDTFTAKSSTVNYCLLNTLHGKEKKYNLNTCALKLWKTLYYIEILEALCLSLWPEKIPDCEIFSILNAL